jgi:hypothetical protein
MQFSKGLTALIATALATIVAASPVASDASSIAVRAEGDLAVGPQ